MVGMQSDALFDCETANVASKGTCSHFKLCYSPPLTSISLQFGHNRQDGHLSCHVCYQDTSLLVLSVHQVKTLLLDMDNGFLSFGHSFKCVVWVWSPELGDVIITISLSVH